jgi:hypothetical protein
MPQAIGGISMLPSFEKTVRAIADTLVQQDPAPADASRGELIATFLLASHARMPDYLRLAIRLLTLFFDASSYPITGRPFHKLGFARRASQFDRWDRSRLKFRQSFTTFYRTLATFGLYSDLYPQDYDSVAQLQ